MLSTDNDVLINASDINKYYEIYEKPIDRLKQFILPKLLKVTGIKRQYYKTFTALNNVSFSVKRGQSVGIIGRNGAGKSTLLQIITGTLTPSSGEIQIRGRIAALLELGSGFNPEFSGRENVYMNAKIYGLTDSEIEQNYARIIAFADIGDFIEQPVKTYSSGMTLRLAFAVIAHVNADILIVDEALSVGDTFFTQKCMRFLHGFMKTGTLLFVSHDTSAITTLCDKAIWIDKGRVVAEGAPKDISEAYLKSSLQEEYGEEVKLEDLGRQNENKLDSYDKTFELDDIDSGVKSVIDYGSIISLQSNLSDANGWNTGEGGEILDVSLSDQFDSDTPVFKGNDKVKFEILAKLFKDMENPILGFIVYDRLGTAIFGENTLSFTDENPLKVQADSVIKATFECVLPFLPNGQFVVMASLAEGSLYDNIQHHYLHDAALINVSNSQVRWGLVGVRFTNVDLTVKAL